MLDLSTELSVLIVKSENAQRMIEAGRQIFRLTLSAMKLLG
jgi:hypothetical protein